jgi:hypothetical protein
MTRKQYGVLDNTNKRYYLSVIYVTFDSKYTNQAGMVGILNPRIMASQSAFIVLHPTTEQQTTMLSLCTCAFAGGLWLLCTVELPTRNAKYIPDEHSQWTSGPGRLLACCVSWLTATAQQRKRTAIQAPNYLEGAAERPGTSLYGS